MNFGRTLSPDMRISGACCRSSTGANQHELVETAS